MCNFRSWNSVTYNLKPRPYSPKQFLFQRKWIKHRRGEVLHFSTHVKNLESPEISWDSGRMFSQLSGIRYMTSNWWMSAS
jgi:hypothetical protein